MAGEPRAWMRDATIEERCEAGISDLLDCIPERHPNHDTYSVFFLVGRRRRDMSGEHTNNPHAQHRGDGPHGIQLPSDPIFVVYHRIPGWQYEQPNLNGMSKSGPAQPLARVFRVEGQRMDLDIAETVSYMRPSLANYEIVEAVIEALEREVDFDNLNNQRILQEMFKRVRKKQPMIPGEIYKPYDGTRMEPRKRYLPEKTIVLVAEPEVPEAPKNQDNASSNAGNDAGSA